MSGTRAGDGAGSPAQYDSIEEYVKQNRDALTRVLKHGNDNFARGCALAALTRGGEAEDIEQVKQQLEDEL